MKNSRLNQSALDQTLQQALTEEVLPFEQRIIQLTQKDYIHLKWQANYWKTQHERVVVREESLKEKIKQLEAVIRDLNQRLYGKKSEKADQKLVLSAVLLHDIVSYPKSSKRRDGRCIVYGYP